MCIEYKGGKCEKCGYDKYDGALEFHHLDPSKKDFAISKKKARYIDKLKPELDKCILLCSNCHRELHGGIE
jgi:5-methylcytosine-specific restriction endonuclease McrA